MEVSTSNVRPVVLVCLESSSAQHAAVRALGAVESGDVVVWRTDDRWDAQYAAAEATHIVTDTTRAATLRRMGLRGTDTPAIFVKSKVGPGLASCGPGWGACGAPSRP
jgi:hypothetical protein